MADMRRASEKRLCCLLSHGLSSALTALLYPIVKKLLKGLLAYFRQHYAHFFPALRQLHRSTFVRQAANLWAIKERLWWRLA
jgi:hypothetical protein